MEKSKAISDSAAKKLLNYQDGAVTITVSTVSKDIEIIQALKLALGIQRVTLNANGKDVTEQSVQQIINGLAEIPSLEEVILHLGGNLHRNFDKEKISLAEFNKNGLSLPSHILLSAHLFKLNQIKKLQISGNLRCVYLTPILELNNLVNLKINNCGITYDTFSYFISYLSGYLPKLDYLNIANNPVTVKSIVEENLTPNSNLTTILEHINNIINTKSQNHLRIDMANCFSISEQYDSLLESMPIWRSIKTRLDDNENLYSPAHLEKLSQDLQELNQAISLLTPIQREFPNNSRIQAIYAKEQQAFQQLSATIEISSKLQKIKNEEPAVDVLNQLNAQHTPQRTKSQYNLTI